MRTIKMILKSKYASYMSIFWRLFLQQIKFCSRCNTHRLQTVWAWNCRVTAVHQYSSEYGAHSLPTRWPCVCVCVSHPGVFVCVYILNEKISFVMKPNFFFLFLSQPKLMAKDLLDLVASHFNLKEKEYFGISYVDETYVYPAHPMKY